MKKVLFSTIIALALGQVAHADVSIPTGSYSGNGVLVIGQTQNLPYKLSVKISLAQGVHTWTQTFDYANGETLTNVFLATLDNKTGFVKIFSVNGQAQTSVGYCAQDQFTGEKVDCTFHWQQNGEMQVDTAVFHKNGTLSQFAGDANLDLAWHDRSQKQ